MRNTQTCPKCSGKKFAVVAELRQPDHDSSNMTQPFPAVTVRVPGFISDRRTLGQFETWICGRCGYTELYAYGLGDIEQVARQWPDQVRIVDATPRAQGPFR